MSSVPSVYAILRNARLYAPERIQSRAGMTKITSAAFDQLLVHTMRRLNDPTVPGFARIIGAGTKLYLATSGAAIDTGYSGNPLSMVPFRPEQSPQAWMYIGDSNKMRKVRQDGTNYQMGIAPPLNYPTVTLGPPAINIIDELDAVGSWVPGGTAGALSVQTRYDDGGGTRVFPDLSSPGWASIIPSTVDFSPLSPLGAGMLLGLKGLTTGITEFFLVQEVLPQVWPASAGITIASIKYDSPANVGNCTVTLNIPPTATTANLGYDVQISELTDVEGLTLSRAPTTNAIGLRRYNMLTLNGAFTMVDSISRNANGTLSFRCFTGGTHVAGEPVVGANSIRGYLLNNYQTQIGELSDKCLQSTIGAGTGTISEITPLNLGIIAGENLPIQQDDLIHLSFNIDNAANLTEVRLLFDVDTQTNDFQHTYYFKSWTVSDIQAALLGNTTIQQARSQSYSDSVVNSNIGNLGKSKTVGPAIIPTPRYRADPANFILSPGSNYPTSTKAVPAGLSGWLELTCKVSDLTKVGTDAAASLSNCAGVRIQITVSSQAACQVDSLWIGGGYGPDIGTSGAPYLYCYRARSSFTGAKSLSSPATRVGTEPKRQSQIISMTQHPDPQVDLLDVFRWGGSLPQWTYVGTTANVPSPTFEDVYGDTDIANNPLLDTDVFQPFPTIDLPRKGTCNVTGTTVTYVSGDTFNPQWYPGSEMVINGIVFNLYSQPNVNGTLEIVQNGGTQTAVPFQLNQPTILGQPLPAFWGPYQQGTGLFCFAVGDSFQPGVLFLTNGNDPDSASDVLQIEITTPSEPLMNGCMFNGQAYVWSSDRFFSLYPSFGSGYVIQAGTLLPAEGTNLFVPLEVPSGKGLYCRFCVAVGANGMYSRARDGIYVSAGGQPQNITFAELGLLFPHDDLPGQPVTVGTFTIYPPDDTLPNLQKLSYYNSFLYYDYQDTQGNKTTLVYSEITQSWSKDDYTPFVASHYGEEGQGVNSMLLGGNDGNVYQAGGSTDGTGIVFPFEARMPQMSELSGSYQQTRDGWMGLMNSAASNLVVNADGVDNLVALPSVGGAYKRAYMVLPPLKARLFAFGLLGVSPFLGIFQRDCEFRAKTWGDGDYTKINPFSSPTRAANPKVS